MGYNVFEDLGFPNAEELLFKEKLLMAIEKLIKAENLTQAEVASLVGMSQPNISRMFRDPRDVSTDKILDVATRLGYPVSVTIHTEKVLESQRAPLTVTMAA